MVFDSLCEEKDKLNVTDAYSSGKIFRFEIISKEPIIYLDKESALKLVEHILEKVEK